MKKLLLLVLLTGCASHKTMVATGGSRSDGIVKVSYSYGAFQVPKIDLEQGLQIAKQRCSAWGYTDAEAFGGQTKTCSNHSMNSCSVWLVTVDFQCLGNPTTLK